MATSLVAIRSWVMQSAEHRFFALAIGIATAVALGWLLGQAFVYLFGNEAALEVIKTVTVAAIVFAVWKIALDHAATIGRFVSAGDVGNCRRAFVELVIAMLGLGVAAGTSGKEPAPAPPSLLAMSFVQPIASGSAQSLTNRIVLPVFTQNLSDNPQLPCEASKTNPALKRLATIDPGAIAIVQEVACGLRACSAGKSVVVDVQGFASSREFEPAAGRACGNSERMNLVLAEMRREAVIGILNGDLSAVANCKRDKRTLLGALDIAAQGADRWPSPAAMEDAREWQDTAGGAVDRAREILTRRVDILIEHKGACGGEAAKTLVAASTR